MEIQQIARQAVEASAVLLKNQDMLPLAPGKQVAFFGWAQWDPVLSGNGSGASHSGRNPSFVESCREAGLEACPGPGGLLQAVGGAGEGHQGPGHGAAPAERGLSTAA